jgi:predicted Zn-dependent protease with MMP-like domain
MERSAQPTSLADFEALARVAFARLPAPFRAVCRDLAIRVEDFPDAEICADMRLDSPYDLLGLYHGVDVMRRSAFDVRQDIDRIYLYREPILAFARRSRDSLEEIVAHVLVHEIGHHFGFSDEDMERIEASEEF